MRQVEVTLGALVRAEVQREQKKAEKLIKEAAKRNDLTSAKVLAAEQPCAMGSLGPAGTVAAASGCCLAACLIVKWQ